MLRNPRAKKLFEGLARTKNIEEIEGLGWKGKFLKVRAECTQTKTITETRTKTKTSTGTRT